ncbi:uncharacterized protein [Dysidea avara]|uniref:uncharacterized protein isoform X2 n=1 Tax=Dysidea avara TaxID=196820 RepID=UPI00332A1A89
MPRSSLHSLLVFYLLLYHLRSTTVTGTQAVTRFQRWIVGDDVSASAESQCSGSVCYWYSYMTRRDGTIISKTSMFTTNQIGEYIWQERGQEVNGARVEVLFIYKVTTTNVSTPIATPPTGNSTNQGSGGDEGGLYTAFITTAGLLVVIVILFLVLVVLYKEAFTPSTSDQDSMRYPITVADADTEEHSCPTMDADQTMHSEPAGIFYPRSSTGNGHEHSHFPPMTGLSYHGDESDDEC